MRWRAVVARPSLEPKGSRRFVRVLRSVLLALLVAFVFGLVVGTMLRRQIERTERYIGLQPPTPTESNSEALASGGAIQPGDIGNALTRVLVSRQHEEQVG